MFAALLTALIDTFAEFARCRPHAARVIVIVILLITLALVIINNR